MENIPTRYKPFIYPSLILGVLLVVGSILGYLLFGQVVELRESSRAANAKMEILAGRLSVLSNIGVQIANQQTEALTALPESNPSLLVSAQVKAMANKLGLIVTDVKSGTSKENQEKEGMRSLAVNVIVTGEYALVVDFIEALGKSTPVTRIRDLNISFSPRGVTADIELLAFWASLPTELPSIDKPIDSLNSDELLLLNRLSLFTSPAILDVPLPDSPTSRPDPFVLE